MKLWLTFYLLVVRADKDNMNWSFKYKFKVLALQYFPFLCNLNLQLKTRLDWEVEKMNDARWSCSVVRSYGSRQHMKLLTQVQTQSRRRASCLFINLCVIPAAWGWNAAVQLRPLRQHTDLHRQPERKQRESCDSSILLVSTLIYFIPVRRSGVWLFTLLSKLKKNPTRLRSWKGRKWGWIKSLWWRRMQRWVTGNKQEAVRLATRHQQR